MNEVVLVTGMSGAGRSTVAAALEDLGWFVIDNLPLELVVRVDELVISGDHDYPGVAYIVGRSGGVRPEELFTVERELKARLPRRARRGAHPPIRREPATPPARRGYVGRFDRR